MTVGTALIAVKSSRHGHAPAAGSHSVPLPTCMCAVENRTNQFRKSSRSVHSLEKVVPSNKSSAYNTTVADRTTDRSVSRAVEIVTR